MITEAKRSVNEQLKKKMALFPKMKSLLKIYHLAIEAKWKSSKNITHAYIKLVFLITISIQHMKEILFFFIYNGNRQFVDSRKRSHRRGLLLKDKCMKTNKFTWDKKNNDFICASVQCYEEEKKRIALKTLHSVHTDVDGWLQPSQWRVCGHSEGVTSGAGTGVSETERQGEASCRNVVFEIVETVWLDGLL